MLYYIASMTKKERWDGRSRFSTPAYKENYNRIFGSVNFQQEGDFIFCSKCQDMTIHIPKFGKCKKCGLEEYKNGTS